METSRCELEDGALAWQAHPEPTREEAVAIAAAIASHLAASKGSPVPEESVPRRAYQIAGRLDHLQGRRVRPTPESLEDPWRLAGRTDRL